MARTRQTTEELSTIAMNFIDVPKRKKAAEPETETAKKPTAKSDGKNRRQKVTVENDGKTRRQKVTAKSDGKTRRQKTTTKTTSTAATPYTLDLPKVERNNRRLELRFKPSMVEQLRAIAEQNNISLNETVIVILSAYFKSRGHAPVGERSG